MSLQLAWKSLLMAIILSCCMQMRALSDGASRVVTVQSHADVCRPEHTPARGKLHIFNDINTNTPSFQAASPTMLQLLLPMPLLQPTAALLFPAATGMSMVLCHTWSLACMQIRDRAGGG